MPADVVRIVYDPPSSCATPSGGGAHAAGSVVLVVLVVILFLQTWRASIIPLIAVPVSVVGTFAFCTCWASRSTR
jgi:multidrug efflux pump subunit AcrB